MAERRPIMLGTIMLLGTLSVSIWAESAPVREASAPAIIGRILPAFYNGYMYSCQPAHVVTLFAPDGHVALTLPIQGHSNGDARVQSVAIDSDGTLGVGWWDPPNAGIDIRDSFGTLIRSIDTGRYIPAHLSFGEDHLLWSLGWQRAAAGPFVPDKLDYATVRKHSLDGKETGAYLPRSLFLPGLEPGSIQVQSRRITVTGDRVGVEVISGNIGNQREWVELDLDGNLIGRWKLDPANQFPGVALTSDNQAYVHRLDRAAKVWSVFRLNRVSSAWESVDAPNADLYGADGKNLVFAHWSAPNMHLSWYPQPQISSPATKP
jgi:hypothetical protein